MVLVSRRDPHARERAEGRLAALLIPAAGPAEGEGLDPLGDRGDRAEQIGVGTTGSGQVGWTPGPPAPVPDPDAEFWEPPARRGRHLASDEVAPAGRGRGLVERAVPATVLQARWTVPWRAAAAVVLVAATLAGAVALRSAAAAPGEAVPVRPAAEQTAVGGAPATSPPPVGEHESQPGSPETPAPPGGRPVPGEGTELVVHVVGQVAEPGVVRVEAGARVADALERAGGVLRTADLARVNLARAVVDGEQIVVPRPGEALASAPGAQVSELPGGTGSTAPVALNTADLAALDSLPGIGPVLAQRILEWRDEHGSFSSVDELGEVSGIGDKVLEQLRPLVTV